MKQFTFLGTGTSVGVPMVGCDCDVCQSTNPRNHRLRCSVLIRTAQGNVLIDTSPDFRTQMLREKVKRLHAVIYTHYHVDHLYGLDDLRPFCKYHGGPLPVHCNAETEEVIRQAFSYAFPSNTSEPEAYVPKLELKRISTEPFDVLGHTITPIPLEHAHFHVLGFRIDNLAYCTDVSRVPETSMEKLRNLDVLILDALRYKPHRAHLSINEALEIIDQLKPKQAYLTHASHDVDYDVVNPQLPPNVELAYDGLSFTF